MMFFEEARQRAEVDHRSNPKDPQVRYPTPTGLSYPFIFKERELLSELTTARKSCSSVLCSATLSVRRVVSEQGNPQKGRQRLVLEPT